MADGRADGSIEIDTKLDAEGFEAGSTKLLEAIKSLTNQIKILGDTITQSFSGKTVSAVSESNAQLEEYRQKVEALEKQLAQLAESGGQANAGINFNAAVRSSSNLEKQVQSLNSCVEKLQPVYEKAMDGSEAAMATLDSATQKIKAEIESLQGAMALLGNTEIPTEQYTWLEQQITKLENTLRRYSDYEEQLKATGVNKHSKNWQTLQYKIQLAEAQLITYQKELEQEKGKATLAKDTAEFRNLATEIQAAGDKLSEMGAAAQAMQPFNEQFGDISERAGKLQDSISKTTAEISKLTAKQDKMKALGTDEQSAAWKSVAYDIEKARAKLSDYQAEAEILKMELGGVQMPGVSTDSAEYKAASASVSDLTSKLNSMAQTAEAGASSAGKTADNIENGAKRGASAFSWLKTEAGGVVSAFGNVGKAAAKAFSKAAKGIKNVIGRLTGMHSSLKSNGNALTGLVKKFTSLSTMLKRMVLRKFISAIISAVKDGINNLALFSDELNEDLSELKSSLTQLKNSFATAAAPIINVITPALTALINGISNALTYIAQFVSALSGKTTYTKAIAVQEDYAESLDSTASSAENAQNALAGFDNLNNVTTSDSSETQFEEVEIDSSILDFVSALKSGDITSTITSLVNAINSGVETLNNALDWDNVGEKVESVVASISNAFNTFINGVDWESVGKAVGTGLNTVIKTIGELINGLDVSGIGTAVAEYLNGEFTNIDWVSLARTLSDGIQTLLDALTGFIDTLDWSGIGTAIGKGLSAIDWGGLLSSCIVDIQNLIAGILTLLTEAVKSTDWEEVGGSIVEAINSIDWASLTGSLSSAASAILLGLLEALKGVIKNIDLSSLGSGIAEAISSAVENFSFSDLMFDASELTGAIVGLLVGALAGQFKTALIDLPSSIIGWIVDGLNSIIDTWSANLEECGGNVVSAILKGISDFFLDIGTWIYEHIFQPFINGFKSFFGISSPSTVMEEMGGYLVEGLLNGISNVWSSITGFFSTALSKLKNTLSTAWNSIKSTASTAWNAVKTSISTVWSNITSTVSSKLSSVKSSLSSAWSSIKSTTSSAWNTVKNSISTVWGSITSTASSKLSSLKSSISTSFSSVVSSAKSWGSDICSSIASGITGAVSTVTSAVSSVASKIKSWLGFSEPEEGPLSNFHTFMPDMLDLMAEGIYDNTPVAIAAVSELADAVTSELQSGDNTLAIDTETKATNSIDGVLSTFADKVSSSFSNLVSKLQTIAESVTFTTPLAANAIPYSITGGGSTGLPGAGSDANNNKILETMQAIQSKIDEVVQAIEDKETGITDADIYSSVKRSVRSEQKSTGRTPF